MQRTHDLLNPFLALFNLFHYSTFVPWSLSITFYFCFIFCKVSEIISDMGIGKLDGWMEGWMARYIELYKTSFSAIILIDKQGS